MFGTKSQINPVFLHLPWRESHQIPITQSITACESAYSRSDEEHKDGDDSDYDDDGGDGDGDGDDSDYDHEVARDDGNANQSDYY